MKPNDEQRNARISERTTGRTTHTHRQRERQKERRSPSNQSAKLFQSLRLLPHEPKGSGHTVDGLHCVEPHQLGGVERRSAIEPHDPERYGVRGVIDGNLRCKHLNAVIAVAEIHQGMVLDRGRRIAGEAQPQVLTTQCQTVAVHIERREPHGDRCHCRHHSRIVRHHRSGRIKA